jgi:hypothetical protein
MSSTREIIILANSAKKGGYCVAGKDIKTGEWIRPVSTISGGELSREQVTLVSSRYSWVAKTLNKVFISFDSHVPQYNQPENHLIDTSAWKPNFRNDRTALDNYLDTPEHLWMYGRKQDRVDYRLFEQGLIAEHQSLYLIKVKSIVYNVVLNSKGSQRVRGTFEYNGLDYTFNVTDMAYCKYKNGPLGVSFTEYDKYLCLSLSEKFEATGDCFKLIASVI